MVDLKSQYEKIKDEVNASIQDVLDTNTYINGPLVHQFQADLEKYLGVKFMLFAMFYVSIIIKVILKGTNKHLYKFVILDCRVSISN